MLYIATNTGTNSKELNPHVPRSRGSTVISRGLDWLSMSNGVGPMLLPFGPL